MIRLLSCDENGELIFHEFEGLDHTPAYAILSHTWHINNKEEVTYHDLLSSSGQHKAGYNKIIFCKAQASADGLAYFWIDTCCINRDSSAELSEAINSMFRWYQNASRCYVFLADVELDKWESMFTHSRWFTRGWTLQELVAPSYVTFFAANGTCVGDKSSLEASIMSATRIPAEILRGQPLSRYSINDRMAWARGRRTKREEDHVYCLLGILDVTMPLVYGEGKERAFTRMYEEISRYTSLRGHSGDIYHDANSTEELILLRHAMRRVEARLITSKGSHTRSLPEQRVVTAPAVFSTMRPHSPCPTKVMSATSVEIDRDMSETSTYVAASDQPDTLRRLLHKLMQIAAALTAPLGYFEGWSSFQPEKYSLSDLGPQIICYSLNLINMGATVATVSQDLWVAKTPREWIRIRLVLTIVIETPYWNLVTGQKEQEVFHVRAQQLPQRMMSLIRETLDDYPDVGEDSEINIRCDPKPGPVTASSELTATSLTRILDSSMSAEIDLLRSYTELLRHKSIRIISEETLVTVYLTNVCFLIYLDDRWVIYYRVPAGKRGRTLWWQRIHASIALRDAPQVSAFRGMVVDCKTKLLKGCLMELPIKGPMFFIMAAHRARKKPIPWVIRQKWAKQIIRGVAEVHDRGQVIAGIRTYNPWVGIDEHDDAVVTLGTTGDSPYTADTGGLLPPECRSETFKQSLGPIGPEFDLFQLGLYLWDLYLDHNGTAATFCSLAGCKNNQSFMCREHDNPVALLKPRPMPSYLDQVIVLCRQANPRDRPAARELLHLFPSDEDISKEIDALTREERIVTGDFNAEDASVSMKRLEVIRRLYGVFTICDLCGEECKEIRYTCEACNQSNWDSCHACFTKGRHCQDDKHLLKRNPVDPQTSTPLTYYSSVKATGKRETTIF